MKIGARYYGTQFLNAFLNYPGFPNRLYMGKPGTWIDTTFTVNDVVGIETNVDGSKTAHISKNTILGGTNIPVHVGLDIKTDPRSPTYGTAQWVITNEGAVVLDSGGWITPGFRVTVEE